MKHARVIALVLVACVLSVLCVGVHSAAASEVNWPTRNVTIVVPFAAGGVTDLLTRVLARNLSEQWGVQVVVENMPGGGSLTGIAHVIAQPADGYTMVCNSPTVMLTQYTTEVFIPFSDFTPLIKVADSFCTLTVHKDVPYNSITEFVEAARTRDEPFTMAVSGAMSIWYALAEEFARAAGIEFDYIPYDGGAPAAAAVAGGHVEACMIDVATIIPLLDTGEIRSIGYFGPSRNSIIPDAQTAIEAGFEGLTLTSFFGIVLPNGVDQAIMDKISLGFKNALESEEVTTFLNESIVGTENGYMPQDEYIAFMQGLNDKYRIFFADN